MFMLIKNANNMLEIIENGKVVIRITKNEENQSLVDQLLADSNNTVQNFNVHVIIPETTADWQNSLIN